MPREEIQFDPLLNNVEAIARLEADALRERSLGERFSDAITSAVGNMTAVACHLAFFVLWVLMNVNLIPGVRPFDPFPFGLLALIFSGEGVLLSIFILISQNRMTRQADRRAHLDLQVSLLAEQELTMILRLQQRLCRHLGMAEEAEEEVEQMTNATDVEHLVNQLKEKLPE